MAGGKGTRLHPYSALLPKPLMPLGDMPILELLLRQMQQAGITDVLVAVNHLRHLIEAFFGDGSKLGLNIRYISEDKPLGTAGALGNMLDLLDESFLLSNGDLLTSMDIAGMARQHFETEADATIGVFSARTKSISVSSSSTRRTGSARIARSRRTWTTLAWDLHPPARGHPAADHAR